FFFASGGRHTRFSRDWSSDVCSSDLALFSLFQQILLRPLPVAEPDRLVNLSDPGPKLDPKNGIGAFASSVSGGPETVFSYPMFQIGRASCRDRKQTSEVRAGEKSERE